jgi:transposase
MGPSFPIIAIQEAGLDGFWIYRMLQAGGIESHVVDPASIATSRRRRRPKTDKIDGEALVRALLAYKRGEPRVCAMVKAPTPDQEDRRRLCRERGVFGIDRPYRRGDCRSDDCPTRQDYPARLRRIRPRRAMARRRTP